MPSVIVLTVDQRGSRHSEDLIPDALERLAPLPTLLAFERTAGDELQGVLDDPDAVAAALGELLRADAWYVGIGVGPVEEPLPDHARAGRGPAYLQARAAVSGAKTSPWHVRVAADHWAGRALETTLWLWAAVLARRTARGWEVADLVAQGLSYAEAGNRLRISQSAVSQRAQAAGIVEARRAEELAAVLARTLLEEER
ncbi:transposase [Nocardioides sp.]|uniref:transposase n=1 Tax=Nocardioides sp. TaxID=35761 RepID=UPI002612DD6E|nr:transposase [Nocardioides sp.]MDI6908994.1 transposase [Nocardioides sp.]